MKSLKFIVIIAFMFALVTVNNFAATETADTLLAKIMLKLISFDKKLERFGSPIKIGVTDDGLLIALRSMGETTIMGKTFSADKIVLSKDVTNYHVVFINNGFKSNLEEIVKTANEKKILTFVGDKTLLKLGFAVALEIEDDLPVIWMNLVNASKAGSEIDMSSLTLVIIKGFIKE